MAVVRDEMNFASLLPRRSIDASGSDRNSRLFPRPLILAELDGTWEDKACKIINVRLTRERKDINSEDGY